jgi:hypothetical protein
MRAKSWWFPGLPRLKNVIRGFEIREMTGIPKRPE